MTVWYTSDLHLGHRLVAKIRGFEDVTAHDESIVEAWCREVTRSDDIVYVLGDLAVANPVGALSALGSLPGRKRLVLGNHDKAHPMFRDAYKWEPKYREVFEAVAPFYRRRINTEVVLLSHFPYTRDRGEARYMQYRLPDMGEWLLHGHTHDSERQVGREIHVGWDAWGELVSEHTIADMMKDSARTD